MRRIFCSLNHMNVFIAAIIVYSNLINPSFAKMDRYFKATSEKRFSDNGKEGSNAEGWLLEFTVTPDKGNSTKYFAIIICEGETSSVDIMEDGTLDANTVEVDLSQKPPNSDRTHYAIWKEYCRRAK